jgi:hypothetical protein
MTENTTTTMGGFFVLGALLGLVLVAPAVVSLAAALPTPSELGPTGTVLGVGILVLTALVLVVVLYVTLVSVE